MKAYLLHKFVPGSKPYLVIANDLGDASDKLCKMLNIKEEELSVGYQWESIETPIDLSIIWPYFHELKK